MSNTQRFTGSQLYIRWIDSVGTVVVSGDQKALEVDWGVDLEDLAAGSDEYHYNYATLKDFSAKLETFLTGTAGTALGARLKPASEGTLIWGELGTAAGMPKWGFGVVVSKNTPKYPFEKAAMKSIEFKVKGGLVYDGNTAVWP